MEIVSPLQTIGAMGFGAVAGALIAWRWAAAARSAVGAKLRLGLWSALLAVAAALATVALGSFQDLVWLASGAMASVLTSGVFIATLRRHYRQ